MSARIWVEVAIIGGLVGVGRFLLDGVVSQWFGRSLPLGTFVINITGSFVVGLSGVALLLLGTAAVGSYTTFSPWMLETHRLGEDAEVGPAIGNVVVSIVVVVVAVVALGP